MKRGAEKQLLKGEDDEEDQLQVHVPLLVLSISPTNTRSLARTTTTVRAMLFAKLTTPFWPAGSRFSPPLRLWRCINWFSLGYAVYPRERRLPVSVRSLVL